MQLNTLYFQIQFTCALVLGINGIRTGCEFPLWMHYMLIIYMLSFIVLFGNFYVKAYMEKVIKCESVSKFCFNLWCFRVNKSSSEWIWAAAKGTPTKKNVNTKSKMDQVLVYNRMERSTTNLRTIRDSSCIQQFKLPDVCQLRSSHLWERRSNDKRNSLRKHRNIFYFTIPPLYKMLKLFQKILKRVSVLASRPLHEFLFF